MPFLALGALAGGALSAAGAAGGASLLGAAATGAGIGSMIDSYSNQKSALGSLNQARNASQINTYQLNEQTKNIARQNAIDSRNLEMQLTPEVTALRQQANLGVLGGLNPSSVDTGNIDVLRQQLGRNLPTSLNTPTLNSAIAAAQGQLNLGGQLPQDVRNLVTRQAISNAGTLGGAGGGLGLGHDLTTRDLGLTSLDLLNQRINTAMGAGQAQQGLAQANAGLLNQDILNKINLTGQLNQFSQQQFGRQLGAAQYGQSIQQPNVGLDPSSVANLAIANQNAQGGFASNLANIYGAQGQNSSRLGGQLLGYGLMGANTGTQNYFGNYNPGGK